MIVVDTSVALKWVLPESDRALALTALDLPLIAPDVWRVEAANGVRRAFAMGQMNEDEARDCLSSLTGTPVQDVAAASLLQSGLDLAMSLRHSIQDCLFLALAIERDCRLLTADVKFRDLVMARSDLGPRIVLLAELFQ